MANLNVENFKSRPIGLVFTHTMVEVLELLRIAPKGSAKIHTHLWTGVWPTIRTQRCPRVRGCHAPRKRPRSHQDAQGGR